MTWFDQLLNWIIPPIVFVALGYFIYKIFKPMLSGLGGTLGLGWEKLKGDPAEKKVNITYE